MTGLQNLLLHGFDQNRIRLALVQLACELTAWMQMLAFTEVSARRGNRNGCGFGCGFGCSYCQSPARSPGMPAVFVCGWPRRLLVSMFSWPV
ncbi:DDE family transposase [Rhodococcus sp. SMB37]|nr:DDE family transposase [Rhodococcus sp. SMB37]